MNSENQLITGTVSTVLPANITEWLDARAQEVGAHRSGIIRKILTDAFEAAQSSQANA